jgi:hypothetical protein
MKSTLTILPLLASAAFALDKSPVAPIGEVFVDRAAYLAGQQADISWNVSYPTSAADISDIDEGGAITVNKSTSFSVKVLGIGMVSANGQNWGNAKIYLGIDNGAWEKPFFNGSDKVYSGPNALSRDFLWVKNRTISEGQKVNFSFFCNTWGQFNVSTRGENPQNIKALYNGDTVPTIVFNGNAAQEGMIESFLAPYIKDNKVTIGPKDIIYFVETTSKNPSENNTPENLKNKIRPFDMQDIVILVTFDQ